MKKLVTLVKNLFKKLGHSISKHKIISIFLVIVIAVGSVFGYRYLNAKSLSNQTSSTYIRTVTLTKSSLTDSISMTGTVESADLSTVTSSLDASIETINVAVGDFVSEDDIICTLDSSDIQEQIDETNDDIADAEDAAQDAYDTALTNKDDAWEDCFGTDGAQDELATAQSNLDTTEAALDKANSKLSTYINAENSASSALTTAGQNLSSSSEAVLSVSNNGNITFYVTTTGSTVATADKDNYTLLTTETSIGTYQLAYVNAYLNEAKANSNLNAAKATYGYTTIENNYNSASATYTQAYNTYESSYQKYLTAEENLATALEELNDGSTNQLETLKEQLSTLEEELEACNLKANTSGKITSLSATVGSKPNGTVATIQDTDNLIIAVSIEEGDVDNVKLGMTCIITSDATDNDIYGEVTQISPVASTSGMGSTASTFAAEITVLNGNNNLLIGMNTNVEIILSTIDDVYSVPFDAVETDANGNSYVYELVSGTGTDAIFEAVQVTIGDETNYYIEVSGENVYEGMVIRASAIESEAVTEVDSSFSLSDLFGGNSDATGPESSGQTPPSGADMPANASKGQ